MKKIEYQRQQVALDGQNMMVENVEKKITIKRGAANKNMQVYAREGNILRNAPPTDLVVTFALYLPDDAANRTQLAKFQRKNNDLVYTHELSLKESLAGEPVRIETLDGRVIIVNVDEVINPKTVRKIEGEGMPIFNRFVKNDHEV